MNLFVPLIVCLLALFKRYCPLHWCACVFLFLNHGAAVVTVTCCCSFHLFFLFRSFGFLLTPDFVIHISFPYFYVHTIYSLVALLHSLTVSELLSLNEPSQFPVLIYYIYTKPRLLICLKAFNKCTT